jgi:hypothetical protein
MALAGCRAPDARPVIWVKNGYCALAVGTDGSYATGYAPTLAQAREIALRECRKRTTDCEIATWVFAGRKSPSAVVTGGTGGEVAATARRTRQ